MKNDEKLDDLLRRSLQAEKTGPVPSAQIQREIGRASCRERV